MTARSTYETSVKNAQAPRVNSNTANAVTHQETVNATILNAGKIMQNGVSAADDRTIRAANAAYVAAKQNAAMIEQVTIDNAKATLRNSGDTGPA